MARLAWAVLFGALLVGAPGWAQDNGSNWGGSVEDINRALQADIDPSPLPNLDPKGRSYTIFKPTAVAEPTITERTRTRVEGPPCPSGWTLEVTGDGWVCVGSCPPNAVIEAEGACVTCPDAFTPARTDAGWRCIACPPGATVRAATTVGRESCVSGPGQTPGESEDAIYKSLMRDALGNGGTGNPGAD